MAIYGAGSMWDNEMRDNFIRNNNFRIGWDYDTALDVHEVVSLLRAGDIIYLKSSKAGSRDIRVKAIGIIERTLIHSVIENNHLFQNTHGQQFLQFMVRWVHTEEFGITIPDDSGRLTNIRSSTFYEENHPFAQQQILDRLFPSS